MVNDSMQPKRTEDDLSRCVEELSWKDNTCCQVSADHSEEIMEHYTPDEMREVIMSNIVHEFKTPLTSIQGYGQLMSDGTLGAVNEQQKKAIDAIIRNSVRLRKLVDALLNTSKADAGKLTYSYSTVLIDSVVDTSIQNLALQADEKGITIIKDLPDELPPLTGDKDELINVMVNLLDNAIRFTPHNGCVQVKVTTTEDHLHICVCDTGIGISKAKLGKLFTRFYQGDPSIQRKYGGTGLGLYICKLIVEGHKGKIWAESKGKKGSIFHVLLPLNFKPEES